MTVTCNKLFKQRAAGLSKYKPISSRHPILGRVLLIISRTAFTSSILAIIVGITLEILDEDPYNLIVIGINLLIFVYLPLMTITNWLIHPLAKEVIEDDPRPLVLYLRSFADDDMQIGDTLSKGMRFEKYLLMDIGSRGLGIPIDIVEPGGELHKMGPARAAFADDEWKAGVLSWMEKAELIILIPNVTQGLRWELEQIRANGYLSKLLLLFPPASDKPYADPSNALYESTSSKEGRWRMVMDALSDLPNSKPLQQMDFKNIHAIHFTSDECPVVLSSSDNYEPLSTSDYAIVMLVAVYGIFCEDDQNHVHS